MKEKNSLIKISLVKINYRLSINDHFTKVTNSFLEATSAFEHGQYSSAARLFEEAVADDSFSFEDKLISQANLFISSSLASEDEFNETRAMEILSLMSGIGNVELRNSVSTTFAQNLSLLCAVKQRYEDAFKFLSMTQENDSTGESDLMNDCFCISFANDRFASHMTPFTLLWTAHLNKQHKTVLQIVGDFSHERYAPFLAACAHLGLGQINEALELFKKSFENSFRVADSLNGAAICLYKLGRIKDCMQCFEKAMRSSVKSSPEAIFNCAEICGYLGRFDEQTALLQIYARLEYAQTHVGSLTTLYKIAKLSLSACSYHEAVSQYQYVLDESRGNGMEPPSSSFFVEFAYALNMIGDFKTALSILPIEKARDDLSRAVCGHSLFLAREYEECEKLIARIDTPDSLCNIGILKFIGDDERGALQLLENTRRRFPKEKQIIRTIVLMRFTRPNTVKSGVMTWLTFLGYQLHHNKAFYEDLIQRLTLDGNADPVTIASLKFKADVQ